MLRDSLHVVVLNLVISEQVAGFDLTGFVLRCEKKRGDFGRPFSDKSRTETAAERYAVLSEQADRDKSHSVGP